MMDDRDSTASSPGRAHFWSAAGSEAPRRFGFGAGATPEPGVITAARRKSKAPSPLRSAGALQNRGTQQSGAFDFVGTFS